MGATTQEPDPGLREAGVNPAQSRYGDQPQGWKSGRRARIVRRPSRERDSTVIRARSALAPSASRSGSIHVRRLVVATGAALLLALPGAGALGQTPSVAPTSGFPLTVTDDEGTQVTLEA